jgi:hypothetical protein
VILRLVDKLRDLVEAEFLGALAEDEQHGVNDVRLAGTVRPHHGGKAFVKGSNRFDAGVGLEILQFLTYQREQRDGGS